jgi:hypothetical protein
MSRFNAELTEAGREWVDKVDNRERPNVFANGDWADESIPLTPRVAMTDWYYMTCVTCQEKSPPLFCIFNGVISLYILDDKEKEAAGKWIEDHRDHKVRWAD